MDTSSDHGLQPVDTTSDHAVQPADTSSDHTIHPVDTSVAATGPLPGVQPEPRPSTSAAPRRRRNPATSTGFVGAFPYPHQRTQSLTSARQPGSPYIATSTSGTGAPAPSSGGRHVRTQTSMDTLSWYASPQQRRADEAVAAFQPQPGTAVADQVLVTRYLRQFLQGCTTRLCTTPLCASNPNFPFKDPNEISIRAFEEAARGPAELCPHLDLRTSQYTGQREIVPDQSIDLSLDNLKALIETCKQEGSFEPLLARLHSVFSSLSRLSMSFADPAMDPKNPLSLLLTDVQQAYWLLQECPAEVQMLIASASERIMSSVTVRPDLVTARLMKGILIIFMNPNLKERPQNNVVLNLCHIVWRSSSSCQRVLKYYLITPRSNSGTGSASLEETMAWLVWLVQRLIKTHVEIIEGYVPGQPNSTAKLDENVISALRCLSFFYLVNQETKLIKYTEFYNETLNGFIDIKSDFQRFCEGNFALCKFHFVLTVSTKANILKMESLNLMRDKLHLAFFKTMFIGVNSPYLVLTIRRDHLIEDALAQLQHKPHEDLKKQLRVKFVDEEGIDEGGVQKEFFQLIMRELIDPKYGMFVTNEETRLCWLASNPLDDDVALDEYNMIGRLMGVAIYNGIILDIHFPLALYKKLSRTHELAGDPRGAADETWELEDLWELDPTLARGLSQLQTFEGDVVEAYDRTFQVEYQSFGQTFTHDLVPDGANIQLTNENRNEFVKEYLKFYFTTSVARQFNAFRDGFHHVTLGSAIQFFRPEEVEQLVCGSPDLDFNALEQVTHYEGGFTARSRIIRWFWEIVRGYEDTDRKRLLFFATGSDRVPIGGLGRLSFTIAKNGPDSMRLPTAHTCYNTLMLCAYSSKERLQERLTTAIKNAEGFGLM